MMKKIKLNQRKRQNNKPYSKITSFLLFLFILFLPTQLGKHFFLPFSYLSGVRVDYLAPTIYLTDIIGFLILIFNWRAIGQFLTKKKVLLILGLLLINVVFSLSKAITIYQYIKIVELLIVFAIFSKHILKDRLIIMAFILTAAVETILAVLQFINKHSLQGIFYFLGERYFNLGTPGIAKASLNEVEILRPYATFSHPNSLAGFYLLVYFFVLTQKRWSRLFWWKNILLFLTTILIFISFSKIAILTYLALNTYYFLLVINKRCRVCVLAKISIITVLSLIFLKAKTDPLTIDKRLELIKNAITIIFKHPIFGVGLGNYLIAQNQFVSKYLYFFNQPVHNIFLLFLAETGLIVTGFILFQFINELKCWLKKPAGFYLIAVIVITGLFDHYWLTLQQNFLLLGVILGSL